MTKKKETKKNTNVAAIPWPTDTWGYTADFRRAFIEMIGKLNGAKDKKKLLDNTMALMLAFKDDRFAEMQIERAKIIKANTKEPTEEITNVSTEEADLQLTLFGEK